MQRIAITLIIVLPAINLATADELLISDETPMVDVQPEAMAADLDACGECCCCDCCCVGWSGILEAWAGYTFLSDEVGTAVTGPVGLDGRDKYASLGLDGRLGTSHGHVWMQGDINGEITSNEFDDRNTSDVNEYNWSAQTGLHVGVRDSCRGYLGAFGLYGFVSPGDGTPQPEGNFSNQHYWATGGELQIYHECSTLYFQAGFLDSRADLESSAGGGAGLEDGLNSAYFLRGVYSWYPSPCSRVQIELAYADGQLDLPTIKSMDVIEWSVRYDTCWHGHPVFFAYRAALYDNDFPDPFDDAGRFIDHTFMVGMPLRRGPCDLQSFDRNGSSLNFPNFGRWVGAGQILDF